MILFHLAICLQSRCWDPGGPNYDGDIDGGPARHTDGCVPERLRACPTSREPESRRPGVLLTVPRAREPASGRTRRRGGGWGGEAWLPPTSRGPPASERDL